MDTHLVSFKPFHYASLRNDGKSSKTLRMAGSALRLTVGQMSFDGGVDSGRVPLIASQSNPNGLKPNQLAWANNVSLRAGGISPRDGWQYRTTLSDATRLFNDAYLFEPAGEFPHLMSFIGAQVFRTYLDTYATDDVTQGNLNPPGDFGWTVQAERFLIHQQDGIVNPLFWDGFTMRRSNGDSTVVGVTALIEVISAIGNQNFMSVNVVDPPGYTGATNAIVNIGGSFYRQVLPANAVTFTNNNDPSIGLIIDAGTLIYDGTGNQIGTVLSDTTIPALAATQATFAAYTVPLPANVVINGYSYTVALSAPPWVPASNIVRVINLNAPPGNIAAGTPLETIPELPAGEAMDYYMGRVWIANGRQYIAGDIVRGPSGSPQYDFEDSVLKNTENAYIVSGGAFIVPTQAGNIRALKHPANINTNLGEGQLLPFTRRVIYSTNVTPTRAAWATLSEPIQRVAQINFGTTGDRTVVPVNGDLYYQSVDGVRSFEQSIREFQQVGNVPISEEESRAINLNDRELLRWGTGVEFNNRLLQSCLPYRVPVGVAHRGVLPLNFDVLNSISGKLPPIWEGVWEGLSILKLLKGDFGGRQRCFALVWSELHQAIELWEQVEGAQEDVGKDGSDRITFSFETPSFDWGSAFTLKELDTVEIWCDRLSGTVDFTLELRPDSYPCWTFYNRWQECAARDSCEDPGALQPCDHPQQQYLPQYRAMMVMPRPPTTCNEALGNPPNRRPMNLGFSFQLRLTVKGFCRIRGIILHAYEKERQPFNDMRCAPINQFQVS